MNATAPSDGARDPLGLVRRFRRTSDGRQSPRLRDLLPTRADRTLDPRGVATAWGEHAECSATCFTGIESLPRGAAPDVPSDATLRTLLLSATARLATTAGPTAVAVSGGLDSALVLALLRAADVTNLQLYTASTGLPGYDERAQAEATARHFGHPLRVVPVTPAELVDALPACVTAIETPLYNLHPLERFFLAKAVAADGHAALVTGDGADQVFAGAPPAIFLPIVAALFEAAGVALRSPFFESQVIGHGWAGTSDPSKASLRALARELGAPVFVLERGKHVRLTPAMELDRHLEPAKLFPLARALGRPLSFASDRERVQWASLGLLWELL